MSFLYTEPTLEYLTSYLSQLPTYSWDKSHLQELPTILSEELQVGHNFKWMPRSLIELTYVICLNLLQFWVTTHLNCFGEVPLENWGKGRKLTDCIWGTDNISLRKEALFIAFPPLGASVFLGCCDGGSHYPQSPPFSRTYHISHKGTILHKKQIIKNESGQAEVNMRGNARGENHEGLQ